MPLITIMNLGDWYTNLPNYFKKPGLASAAGNFLIDSVRYPDLHVEKLPHDIPYPVCGSRVTSVFLTHLLRRHGTSGPVSEFHL